VRPPQPCSKHRGLLSTLKFLFSDVIEIQLGVVLASKIEGYSSVGTSTRDRIEQIRFGPRLAPVNVPASNKSGLSSSRAV
jgi:hypothetical protein